MENKKYVIISFVTACLLLFLQAILFWNASEQKSGIWPFILLILALLAIGYIFSKYLKSTNADLINAAIEEKVSQERIRLIKEFEKKNESQEEIEDKDDFIENKVKDIIPKGNFKSVESLLEKYLKNLANTIEIVQGIVYLKENDEFVFSSGFALTNENKPDNFKPGETLPGQVAVSKTIEYINDIPEDFYPVISGLGQAKPRQLVFIPVILNTDVMGILELAAFNQIDENNKKILELSLENITSKIAQTIKS